MEEKKTSLTDLYKELRKILVSGDEEGLKRFFLEHFEELPKDLQDDFLFFLFEESLEGALRREEEFLDFAQKISEGLGNLERMKGEVKDRIELLEEREKLEKLKKEK